MVVKNNLEMEDIIKILTTSFTISNVAIENFTVANSDVVIKIELFSAEYGSKVIEFGNVSRININSGYYSCSVNSSIIIEDLSDCQMEEIRYKIAISEDVMTFYCEEIKLLETFCHP